MARGKATKANCGASMRHSGEVLETLEMPHGVGVSGLEYDGKDRFYCGGGSSGTDQSRARAEAHRCRQGQVSRKG